MRSKWTTGLGMVLGVAFLAACGPADEPAAERPAAQPQAQPSQAPAAAPADLPEGVTAEMFAQGRELFNGQGICFTCHSNDGVGGPLAPDLTDGDWIWFDGTPNLSEIETLIRTGVAQPRDYPAPMPPMGGAVGLTDDQVRALAGYVLAISQGN